MSKNAFKYIVLFIGLSISLGVLVLGFLNLRSYYSRASASSDPTNVTTANISATSAQVTWQTDSQNQGLVRYSTDPSVFELGTSSSILFATESNPSQNHLLTLSLLKGNTTYYFEIIADDKIYGQAGLVKDNKHLPFSFTTEASAALDTSNSQGLDPNAFKQRFGSSDPLYDLNKDGTVNSTDYLLYLSRNN